MLREKTMFLVWKMDAHYLDEKKVLVRVNYIKLKDL